MIYLIGGNGFVGSAFARLFQRLGVEHKIITRDNKEEFKNTSCDILINANGNSKKYMADRDPEWEFEASVTSVANSLEWYKAGRYVLLSSGDVYPETASPALTQEGQEIDHKKLSRYGLHKLMAEKLVREIHPNYLIMRMGGFVGPHLSKNAIYDMMRDDPLWLSLDSRLQFIHTDDAAEIVWALAQNDAVKNEIVNLGASGTVALRYAHSWAKSRSEVKEEAKTVTYELSLEKLQRLYGLELPESAETVRRFILDKAASAGQG